MLIGQCILKRDRIVSEFHNITNYPLTLVVASMGYGKTTAIRDYLYSINIPYAYLSIESIEVSPHYIWDSLVRQLMKSNSELSKQLCEFGFPVNSHQVDKILRILEDYSYNTKNLIVIDDYHFCRSQEFNNLIERIVRNKIKGLHILILSRMIPHICIDELILKGICYHIRSNCFDFTIEEIRDYFKLYGNNISSKIAEKIHEVSEGWVSAIYLIMIRFAESGKIESGRSLERLIESGVMWRYTEQEVEILRSLCFLDTFSTEQAIYVTSGQATESVLHKLSYENCFIRYDEHLKVYRVHNIFNNFLRKLLKEDTSGLHAMALYLRAGDWYIENGDVLSGFNYFLKAKEYDRILLEIENRLSDGFIDKNQKYLIELLRLIPLEVKYRHPFAYLAYLSFYITNVNLEEGERLLSHLELQYLELEGTSPEVSKRISGEVELIRAYIDFNNVNLMYKRFIRAYKLLNGRSKIATKNTIVTFGSPLVLYLFYSEKGKLLLTMEQLVTLFSVYQDLTDGCGIGIEHLIKAEYNLEIGQLEEAIFYANKAIIKAKIRKQISIIICAKFVLARVFVTKGSFDKAYELLDDLNVEIEVFNNPILSSTYDLCTGYIAGITNEEIYFSKWLRDGEFNESRAPYQVYGFNYIVYGKYLLYQERNINVEVLCEEMVKIFEVYQNQIGFLHMHLLSAAAKYKLYGLVEAKKELLIALEKGRIDNIVQPFVEYGKNIYLTLKDIQATSNNDKYLNRIIEITECYLFHLSRKDNSYTLLPVLTKRETEVLKLIIEGQTNQTIAMNLCLAEVTVRKNITSIYRKLNVSGRASAVKKAMELKLFDFT